MRSSLHAYYRYSPVAFALAVFCASMPSEVRAQLSPQVFATDLTKDIYRSGGEPQITVNPKNPRQLAILEYTFGSKAVPGYSLEFAGPEHWRQLIVKDPHYMQTGVPLISNDGGNTWKRSPQIEPVYYDKNGRLLYGSVDPMVAAGPDGTLYLSTEVIDIQLGAQEPRAHETGWDVIDVPGSIHSLAYSTDWGKTWSKSFYSDQPIDRPWLKVDQTTGKVYVASTGQYDPATGLHNTKDVGIMDRWLVTWQPQLKGKSPARRMGGPEKDLTASVGNDLAAAYGTVAEIFIVGGKGRLSFEPPPVGGAAPPPMPASLRSIVPAGIECVQGQPACLIFQTSDDDGEHWVRHFVPTPEGFAGGFMGGTSMAADPGQRGRFAISLMVSGKLMSIVTNDFGKTWSAPAAIPETAAGDDFKIRVAYSPNGVLTSIWKKQRTDLNKPVPPPPAGQPVDGLTLARHESSFDVYTSISCDGGLSWPAAIRINSKPSPQGDGRGDDLTYLDADTQFAHVVWGDRRMTDEVKKAAGDVPGPIRHAYYGRVPFSAVSKRNKCGR
jgi:hypothetical protein